MNRELWKQAYNRLSIYGETPPAVCWSRLAAEEAAFHGTNAIQSFAILGQIEEEAQKKNAVFFVDGAISSSFAAWLFGATKVNPLPPHYRCPKCRRTEFVSDVKDGFDLEPKKCVCGEDLIRDGHNIPFEGVAKEEQRGSHVHIRLSEAFEQTATDIIKSFYDGKAELIQVKLTAQGRPIDMRRYVVLKENKAKPTLSEDGAWHVDNEEYWKWQDDETTFTLYLSDQIERLDTLQQRTNEKHPDPMRLLSKDMIERLYERCRKRSLHIAEQLNEEEPHDFDLLLRLEGFACATGAWSEKGFREYSDGEKIYREGRASFREIPAFREDIWNDISMALARNGIRDNGLALQVMEDVGKLGKYYQKMPESIEKLLMSLGLPEWYPEYLKNVMYMFPKGHCISLLMRNMIYEWYGMNYPEVLAVVEAEDTNQSEGSLQ